MLVLLLAACAAPPPAPAPAPAPAAPAPADDHAKHMGDMAATREALREELGPAYDQPVSGLEAADREAGRALYVTHCAACHGESGKGDGPAGAGLHPPPADFTDAFHARYYSDAGRIQVIRKGAPGTAMAGFAGALTEEQIVTVYAHVAGFRP